MKILKGTVRHIITDYVIYMPTSGADVNIALFDIEARGNNGLLHWDCSNGYYVGHIFKTLRGQGAGYGTSNWN